MVTGVSKKLAEDTKEFLYPANRDAVLGCFGSGDGAAIQGRGKDDLRRQRMTRTRMMRMAMSKKVMKLDPK
jgi:hypothetical protein